MTLSDDRELRDWIDAWQAPRDTQTVPVERISARVRRRVRVLRAWAVLETVVAIVALAVVSYRAIVDPDPFEKIAMALLGAIAVSGLAASWWNWRGVWRSSAQTTSAFLAISIIRTRRFTRYLQAGWVILAAELAVFVPWIRHRLYVRVDSVDPATEWFAWSLLGTLTLAAVVSLIVAQRWARREGHRLALLEREIRGSDMGDPTVTTPTAPSA